MSISLDRLDPLKCVWREILTLQNDHTVLIYNMSKSKKVPNRYMHSTYGFVAHFKFFGKRFLVPLKTQDESESLWRIDVAAHQLAEFFEEPRELLAPDRQDEMADVPLANSIYELELAELKSNRVHLKVKESGQAAHDEMSRSAQTKSFRAFLWEVAAAQIKVQGHCDDLNVDLSQVEIKKQQLQKNWAETLRRRKATESFLRKGKLDGIVIAVENLSVAPRNLAANVIKIQRAIDRLAHLRDGDRRAIKMFVDSEIILLQSASKRFSDFLKLVKSAANATPVKD